MLDDIFHPASECRCPSDEIHATWHMEYHLDEAISHEHSGYVFKRCLACSHYFVLGIIYDREDRDDKEFCRSWFCDENRGLHPLHVDLEGAE